MFCVKTMTIITYEQTISHTKRKTIYFCNIVLCDNHNNHGQKTFYISQPFLIMHYLCSKTKFQTILSSLFIYSRKRSTTIVIAIMVMIILIMTIIIPITISTIPIEISIIPIAASSIPIVASNIRIATFILIMIIIIHVMTM